MIDCQECKDYATLILSRGEITEDEVPNLILNRHILKGCDKKTHAFKDWLEEAIENHKKLLNKAPSFSEREKGYLEALIDAKMRYTNECTF